MNKLELEKLGIYELRTKARNVGVRAPTMKKREVLIDEILKIENGEIVPTKTNMGRPPKNVFILGNEIDKAIMERTIIPQNYEKANFADVGFKLKSEEVLGINSGFNFCGIVREVLGQKFVKDYNSDAYVILQDDFADKFVLGDYIAGTAISVNNNYGLATKCDFVNVSKNKNVLGKKASIVFQKNTENMFDYAIKDKSENKYFVITEARFNEVPNKLNGAMVLKTNECEDIVLSYNMLLDVKNMAKRFAEKDIPFTIYLFDVEYMYSIMGMYFTTKNCSEDVNCGQYFKELLSIVTNSNGGKVVVFEKENNKRSSYLDIILNRYCQD